MDLRWRSIYYIIILAPFFILLYPSYPFPNIHLPERSNPSHPGHDEFNYIHLLSPFTYPIYQPVPLINLT